MPITPSNLVADKATAIVKTPQGDLHVDYTPSKFTTEWLRRDLKRPITDTIIDLVDAWDLVEEDDTPFPLTAERLLTLPIGFLQRVYDAVTADARQGDLPEAPGSSDAS